MSGTADTRPARRPRAIPFYWWPFWMLLLAIALFVFYVLFTPAWIVIRTTARLSERTSRRPQGS